MDNMYVLLVIFIYISLIRERGEGVTLLDQKMMFLKGGATMYKCCIYSDIKLMKTANIITNSASPSLLRAYIRYLCSHM